MSEKKIISSGWYCNKNCPFWKPGGFEERCTAYGNIKLVLNPAKDMSRRCGECLADYPTTSENTERTI